MKKLALIAWILLIAFPSVAQKKPKSVQDFMNAAGIKPAKVMLVGTFHFAYQNLDQHKIESKNQRDILSEKSQQELQQLLDVFKAYKPTRIYLESADQHWLDSCYAAFTDSTLRTQRNERVQIGFRLARELKMSKVYSVDAGSLINEWNEADSLSLAKILGSDSVANKQHSELLNKAYGSYYSYADSIEANLPLLEAITEMNEPRNLQLSHGAYLSGYFNTIGNYGPDVLSTWWVNRNIRIFNNVLLTRPGAEDRILIIFGAGHVPLLKQCFESSPDFELVDFYKAAVKASTAKKVGK